MATTQNTFTGDGSTVLFSFTFPYIKESDVSVTIDGTTTTAYSFATATSLEFNTAPANGAAIRIFRDTDIDTLSATFFPGSALKAEDLNDNFTQAYYAVQETDNDVATANTTAASAVTTAEGAVTTANAAAVDAATAVTTANTANTNATAAQTAATAAETAATNAETSATAAQASATAAAADAATAAADAATAATDAATAVSTANTANTTAASAVTTANAAATDAATAVTTANTANTNATAAQTAATQAATDAAAAQTSATAAQASATAAATSAADAAADAAASANVADAFTATGTPATALTVDVPIDVANGVKLPTNSNTYDEEGAIRYNTTLDKIEIRKGSGWSTAAGGAAISSTPPTLATAGDVWYDHDNGRAYVYYNDGDSDQWVEMNPSWNGFVSDGSVTPAKLSTGGPYWATNGNVGIGTTSPSTSNLAIVNTSNAVLTVGQNVDGTGLDHLGISYGSSTGSIFTSNGDLNIVVDGGSGSGSSINLINGSGDRVVFDSSGNVGIGTTTPVNLLQLNKSDSGSVYLHCTNSTTGTSANDGALIGLSGAEELTLFNRENNDIKFGTNDIERLRIDSSGNVGVGTTSPSAKLDINSSDFKVAKFSRTSGSGAFISLNDSATTADDEVLVGAIGNDLIFHAGNVERARIDSSGRLLVGLSSSTGLSSNSMLTVDGGSSSACRVNLVNSGSSSVESTQFGSQNNDIWFNTNSSERMRLLSSGGITFNGDTSTNNALDDYEEGSWTPTVDYGVISYAANSTKYTKIGRKVHLTGYIYSFSNRTQSSYVGIGGLPFSIASSLSVVGGSAMTRNASVITPVVYYSGTRFYFYGNSSGSWIALQHSDLNASTAAIYFSLTYLTD